MKNLPKEFFHNWLYQPYISIGPLRFGMSRKQVYEILGEPTEFDPRSTSTDGTASETYRLLDYSRAVCPGDCDITLSFGLWFSNDQLEYVSLGAGTDPVFMGIHLLTDTYESVLWKLKKYIPEIDPDASASIEIDSPLLGFTTGANWWFGTHDPETERDTRAYYFNCYWTTVAKEDPAEVLKRLQKALLEPSEH